MGTQPNSRRLTRNPKYVTIRNLLRDHILAGRYGLGNRLPSESALMSQFAEFEDSTKKEQLIPPGSPIDFVPRTGAPS